MYYFSYLVTIVAYTRYKDINSIVGVYFTVAFGVVLGIIGIAALIAICAICLSNSESYCCCVLYCFLALIVGLIFLGIGIASYVAIPRALGDNCTSNSYFQDIQNFAELA
jgi:hypothetical protein